MNTIILIIYLIGVVAAPISILLFHKYSKIKYTVKDLLFSILTCWISWLIVLVILVTLKDEVIFKFDKND